MPLPEPNSELDDRPGRSFATTRWSVIAAAQVPDSPEAQEALAVLCQAYWYPLYAYIRRQGHSPDQAQDLTQGFFAWLLERRVLDIVDQKKGRFRSFLLGTCKHYLAHEYTRQRAQKRGGGRTILSLDFAEGEARYRVEPSHTTTPEKLFDRRWALALLDQSLTRLRGEFLQKGKQALFDRLRVFLLGEDDAAPYAAVARDLNMTEGAVKVAAHRLRRRFQELVREVLAETVESPEEVEEEIRELFDALRA